MRQARVAEVSSMNSMIQAIAAAITTRFLTFFSAALYLTLAVSLHQTPLLARVLIEGCQAFCEHLRMLLHPFLHRHRIAQTAMCGQDVS